MKISALIVAAGSSVRFGGAVPKQFCEVAGRPLLAWTIGQFEKAESIDSISVVVAEDQLLYTSEKVIDPFGFRKVTNIVPGGVTRQESVLKGLERLPVSTGMVAIHDGARPMTSPDDIDTVVELARAERAAMLVTKVSDTVKRAKDGYILATLDRSDLFLAQTPQVFAYDLIIEAHRRAAAESLEVTDDAALIETNGFKVRMVESSTHNTKVTSRGDLHLVEAMLREGADG
jgi:2-C-methyl-D-erythritol 4-phosphate cytidylyltransferase